MDRCVWSNFSFVIWLVVHPTHIWCTPECTVLTVEERCRSVWWNTVEYQGLNIFVGKVMKALMRVGALTARIRETSRSCVLNCAGPWEARQLVRDTPLYADLYGGLQPRWPLVLRSLQLPHAFYTSMYRVFHNCWNKAIGHKSRILNDTTMMITFIERWKDNIL